MNGTVMDKWWSSIALLGCPDHHSLNDVAGLLDVIVGKQWTKEMRVGCLYRNQNKQVTVGHGILKR